MFFARRPRRYVSDVESLGEMIFVQGESRKEIIEKIAIDSAESFSLASNGEKIPMLSVYIYISTREPMPSITLWPELPM